MQSLFIHSTLFKNRHIIVSRSSLLFRGTHYSTELESYVNVLGQFRACLHYVLHLPKFCEEGILYPNEELLTEEEFKDAYFLMTEAESLSQEYFYERPLAFQVRKIKHKSKFLN